MTPAHAAAAVLAVIVAAAQAAECPYCCRDDCNDHAGCGSELDECAHEFVFLGSEPDRPYCKRCGTPRETEETT